MNDTEKIMVSLSQEELFVILTYLKADSLMGLNGAILNDLSEKEIHLVLGVAERALVARGFLTRGDESRFQLTPAILSIVGACAKPGQSLIINYDRPERPTETFFFHKANSMLVGHTIPMSAIHQFAMLDSNEAIQKSVSSLLTLDSQEAPSYLEDLAHIPQPLITEARSAAYEGDAQQATAILSRAKLSPKITNAFVTSLANPIANMTIVYLEHQSGNAASADGFTILQGSNGFWILKPDEDASLPEDYVSVRPVSAQDTKELVWELISQL